MTVYKEPWEAFPQIWKSKASFFNYLRGGLRQLWSRYPGKLEWKKNQLFPPPKGYSGRAKKLGICYYCGESFAASHLEVDHVEQAGTCNSWTTAHEFLRNLLDCNDNWVLACKPCHKIKSYAEKQGINFAEAVIKKRIIEFMKKPVAEILECCKQHGYLDKDLTNATKRKAAVSEILRREND